MASEYLTPELLLAVPCPTCGVDAGKGCVLHTGGPSPDLHVDRTLDAARALEAQTLISREHGIS
jgi:hypothetical protein